MDYCLPSALEVPDVELRHFVTPSDASLGGYKGVGEAGTQGAPGAVLNAIADALAPLHITVDRNPMDPNNLLSRIIDARERAASSSEQVVSSGTTAP